MWKRLVAWFNGLFGTPKPLSALEAMDAIQREKRPAANPAQWSRDLSTFKSAVFSERDRKRLWRRHRRDHDHAQEDWPLSSPTTADHACLKNLLEALQR